MMRSRVTVKALQFYPAFWLKRAVGFTAVPREYRRFVVVCAPRVGSNLLRSLLNSHTALLAVGEVFRESQRISWDMPWFPTSAAQARLRDQHPETFLAETVFGAYPSRIRAVGFKLFYDQAREGRKRRVWDVLAEDPELLVIHLKRRNLLRGYLSMSAARQTGQWVQQRAGSRVMAPIRIDPEACLRFFQRIERQQEETDRLFRSHAGIVLHYEDLAVDYASALEPVFSTLGVAPEAVKPRTYKQSSLPLNQAIENFDELKSQLAKTRWGSFFD